MRHGLDAPYKVRQSEQPQLSENGEETLNRRLSQIGPEHLRQVGPALRGRAVTVAGQQVPVLIDVDAGGIRRHGKERVEDDRVIPAAAGEENPRIPCQAGRNRALMGWGMARGLPANAATFVVTPGKP